MEMWLDKGLIRVRTMKTRRGLRAKETNWQGGFNGAGSTSIIDKEDEKQNNQQGTLRTSSRGLLKIRDCSTVSYTHSSVGQVGGYKFQGTARNIKVSKYG